MKTLTCDRIFDELLYIRYREGGQRALSLLIKRWHPKLVAFIFKNIRDREAARDIAQDVWIAALKNNTNLDH